MSVSDLLLNAPLDAQLTGILAVVRSETIEVGRTRIVGRTPLRPGTPSLCVLLASSEEWGRDVAVSGERLIPVWAPRMGTEAAIHATCHAVQGTHIVRLPMAAPTGMITLTPRAPRGG
jgi:hypothetical protein